MRVGIIGRTDGMGKAIKVGLLNVRCGRCLSRMPIVSIRQEL